MDSIYTSYKESSETSDSAHEPSPASKSQDSPSLGEDASGGVKNAPSALNKVKPDADARPSRPGNAGPMPDFRINGTGLARATFLTVGEA